jgi:hypothetical protein
MTSHQSLRRYLVLSLWKLSQYTKYANDITSLCIDVAGDDNDGHCIRDQVIDGLIEMSDDCAIPEGTEYRAMGHTIHDNLDVYWTHTNAYTEWYSDKPEKWDIQIAQWAWGACSVREYFDYWAEEDEITAHIDGLEGWTIERHDRGLTVCSPGTCAKELGFRDESQTKMNEVYQQASSL